MLTLEVIILPIEWYGIHATPIHGSVCPAHWSGSYPFFDIVKKTLTSSASPASDNQKGIKAMSEELKARIAALQAELKGLEDSERNAQRERLKAFKKQWQFTIKPQPNQRHWDTLHDDTIVKYHLAGVVLNADDYKAIGGDKDRCSGGMAYLYNTLTKRIVMRLGGGSIFIPDDCDNTADIYVALAAFISDNPQGGDVTSIIVTNPNFRWH